MSKAEEDLSLIPPDQFVLRMDNEDRLRKLIEETFLVCLDRIVDKFAQEGGSDRAELYRSFLPGGRHYKLSEYVMAVVKDSIYAQVKAAAKDAPDIKSVVRLPVYDRWSF